MDYYRTEETFNKKEREDLNMILNIIFMVILMIMKANETITATAFDSWMWFNIGCLVVENAVIIVAMIYMKKNL